MNQRRRLGAFKRQILKMRSARADLLASRARGATTQTLNSVSLKPTASQQQSRPRYVKRSVTGGVNVIVNK